MVWQCLHYYFFCVCDVIACRIFKCFISLESVQPQLTGIARQQTIITNEKKKKVLK